ncbi:hypothetical protein HYU12_05435 [Candidatus Woesearchaeota archaeon]|nr:hypothetical protein [Candidatus Woesearchaeota archaeon]
MGFVIFLILILGVVIVWKLAGLAVEFLFHPVETGRRVLATLVGWALRAIVIIIALSILGHLVK